MKKKKLVILLLLVCTGIVLLQTFNSGKDKIFLCLDWIWEENNRFQANRINFGKTDTGELLFFSPQSRLKLADLLSNKFERLQLKVVEYNPNSGEIKNKTLSASASARQLRLGEFCLSEQETNRLRISQDWQLALAWLQHRSLDAGMKERIDTKVISYSIDKVKQDEFLIAGGQFSELPSNVTKLDHRKCFEEYSRSARILDLKTGGITKSIPLQLARYNHASVCFPDGRVLLVGGLTAQKYDQNTYYYGSMFSPATMAELVDTNNFTTQTFPCSIGGLNSYCVESNEKCIWVEDEPSMAIYRIDIQNHSVSMVGKLKNFNFPDPSMEVPQNAVELPENRVLVCGGAMKRLFSYPTNVASAEIVRLSPGQPMP